MLKIENLTKKFKTATGEFAAVNNLTLQIQPGEIYSLIGPNGAGKTTTIKIIVGLYRKDGGRITLFDEDITNDEAEKRKVIGYIPDEPVFYPYLTGYEHLNFIRALYKVSDSTFKKHLPELLKFYPMGDILSDYPAHFSRGNKQKLSIIAAFIHHPRLLVVDEPIVGLDPQSAEQTERLFREFADTGGMILISTHTLSFVEKVADKTGIIDNGKKIFEGSITDIKKRVKGAKTLSSAFVSLTESNSRSYHV